MGSEQDAGARMEGSINRILKLALQVTSKHGSKFQSLGRQFADCRFVAPADARLGQGRD
jgi:hypothetical protein